MASGKTSVGRRVAKRLGFRFLDMDQFIEQEQGRTIASIFAAEGEPHFRALETALLGRLTHHDNTVFSCGGGIVTTPGNLELLKQVGVVVFLNADPEDIIRRLEHDTRRPKVKGGDLRERVTTLLAERMPLYAQADIVIHTLGKTPNQVAGEVIGKVAGRGKAAPKDPSDAAAGVPSS
jgi:shikimate kinase